MNEKGFTLLEILIAMAIVTGITFSIGLFGNDLTKYSLRFNNSLVIQQEIQQTLQIMIPEIRSASQSNNGIYPIEEASSTSFIFYSDINVDGKFDRVRYFLNGTTFQKGVIKPTGSPLAYVTSTETVVDVVHNMVGSQIFSYYDSNATSTNSAALVQPVDVLKVKMVKVSLVANQGINSSTPAYVGVENQATIRNLRYK
jgi:prepilin-type N-terminal cleavage/methylation domain-containing protein